MNFDTQQKIKHAQRKATAKVLLIGLLVILFTLVVIFALQSNITVANATETETTTPIELTRNTQVTYAVGRLLGTRYDFSHVYTFEYQSNMDWNKIFFYLSDAPDGYSAGNYTASGEYPPSAVYTVSGITADYGMKAYENGDDIIYIFAQTDYSSVTYDPTVYVGLNTTSETVELSCFYGTPGVSLPPDPTAPEGQHFAGWYYDAELTTPYVTGDIITEDTELYAKFEINTYTITYILDGEVYQTVTLEHGAAISNLLPEDIDVGKFFGGWHTDSACETDVEFPSTAVNDITLYGQTETTYLTVTFYVGNTVYATKSVAFGSTLVVATPATATAAAISED